MNGQRVTVGAAGLVWDGEEHLILSGEVHSWRLDPARWPDILDAVASLGFTTVSLYVPWCVHEVAPGEFDFSGARDLRAILSLIQERGLKAMVRIGPDSGAELETSGWPRWVLDDERCQALRPNGLPYLLVTSTGHCFPPSYASTVFRQHVRRWCEEIVPYLAELQYPDGPIVACQVDNELGFHFQANSFALDYHPEAVESWREWSGGRWAEPPRDGSDEPEERRLSWVEWREVHRREVLSLLASWARELGMDRVPIFHNDYPRTDTPMDLAALEREGVVDWATADVYSTRHGGRFVRDLARRVSAASRFPFLAELGAGWLTLPWLLPLAATAADEEVIALRTFFSGIRGANVYMLVERDRWYGSPIAADGTARVSASLYPRLRELLDEIDWLSLERVRDVLVIDNRAESRREAARDTLGGVVPSFAQLLPLDYDLTRIPGEPSTSSTEWAERARAALDASNVDYDIASSSSLNDLERYSAIVVPAAEVLDSAAARLLLDAARSGTTVLIGPSLPTRDERLRPLAVDLRELALIAEAEAVVEHLPQAPVRCANPAADLHVWRGRGRQFIAAFNAGDQLIESKLEADGSTRLVGMWTRETLTGDGSFAISLPPWAAQVWEAQP